MVSKIVKKYQVVKNQSKRRINKIVTRDKERVKKKKKEIRMKLIKNRMCKIKINRIHKIVNQVV